MERNSGESDLPPDRAARREALNAGILSNTGLTHDLGRRTAVGGVVVVSGQALSMVVQFASLVILGRLLDPADFGIVAMAAAVTAFATIFADMGLTTATIQRRDIDQNIVSALFFLNLAAGIGVMLLAWAAAPFSSLVYDDPRVGWVVVALAATLPLTSLGAQHQALLTRRMQWMTLRAVLLCSEIAGLAVAASLAAFTSLGYWALVANVWVTALLATSLYWYKSHWRPSFAHRWREARDAIGFGLHLTGAGISIWVGRQLDNVLVGARLGDSVLGQYSRAYVLYMIPINLVSGPLHSAMVPALSRLHDQPERWRALLLEAQAGLFMVNGLLAALLIASGQTLMVVLLGPQWEPAGRILQILALAIPATMVANTTGWIFISCGRSDRMLRWNLMRLPPLIAGFVVGVQYGAEGMAWAVTGISYCLLVPNLLYVARGTPVTAGQIMLRAMPPWGLTIAAIAGARLGAGVVVDAPAVQLIVEAGASILCYVLLGAAIFLLHPQYAQMKSELLEQIARVRK